MRVSVSERWDRGREIHLSKYVHRSGSCSSRRRRPRSHCIARNMESSKRSLARWLAVWITLFLLSVSDARDAQMSERVSLAALQKLGYLSRAEGEDRRGWIHSGPALEPSTFPPFPTNRLILIANHETDVFSSCAAAAAAASCWP